MPPAPQPQRPGQQLPPPAAEPAKPGFFARLIRTVLLLAIVMGVAALGYNSQRVGKARKQRLDELQPRATANTLTADEKVEYEQVKDATGGIVFPWKWTDAEWKEARTFWKEQSKAAREAGRELGQAVAAKARDLKSKIDEKRGAHETTKKDTDDLVKATPSTAPATPADPKGQQDYVSGAVAFAEAKGLVDGIFGAGKSQDQAQADLAKAKGLLKTAKEKLASARANGVKPEDAPKLEKYEKATADYTDVVDSMLLH